MQVTREAKGTHDKKKFGSRFIILYYKCYDPSIVDQKADYSF